MVAKVQASPEELNRPATWLADTGYYSEKNVAICVAAKIKPLIAVKGDASSGLAGSVHRT